MGIRTFDIDGVICMGSWAGVRPFPNDIIITGRSYEEKLETLGFLAKHGIDNEVYFNPVKFDEKSRESSGHHKAKVLITLVMRGIDILCHFEDDPVQAEIIAQAGIQVVLLKHDLVNKENIRRDADGNELT